MARQQCTPDQLDAMASELSAASDRLKAVAAEMREASMPHLLLHSAMYLNVHLPATAEFSLKVQLDSISQIRSFSAGNVSRVETRKRYNDNQKLAAAKKTGPKKAVKKKA